MLDQLTSEHFSSHINQNFSIILPDETSISAELIEVTVNKAPGESSRRKSFSLVFRTDGEPKFDQGIYTVRHENMPELDIFLVPIGPDSKGFCYEAIFN